MLRIGWSSPLRPALRWYRLVGMRAAGSLILPGKASSPGATILAPMTVNGLSAYVYVSISGGA